MMGQASGVVIGLVSLFVFMRVAVKAGQPGERNWYAGGLLVAAGAYAAFGLVLGGPPLGFELAQLAVFVAIAVAGFKKSPLILVAGWILHAVWDTLHHLPPLSEHAPVWYVYACIVFDIGVALFIFKRRAILVATTDALGLAQTIHSE